MLICTTDKDCRQLINDHVRLYNLRKREEYGRAELLADWGITPEQVVDLQTLVGDSVDNVPGVAGIGYKTAAKLLQEFGTLDTLLKNIDKVPGPKKQENLRAAEPLLPISRKLVTLAEDVPVTPDWEGWRLKPLNVPRLLALFQEWGLGNLARQLRKSEPKFRPRHRNLWARPPARPRGPPGPCSNRSLTSPRSCSPSGRTLRRASGSVSDRRKENSSR